MIVLSRRCYKFVTSKTTPVSVTSIKVSVTPIKVSVSFPLPLLNLLAAPDMMEMSFHHKIIQCNKHANHFIMVTKYREALRFAIFDVVAKCYRTQDTMGYESIMKGILTLNPSFQVPTTLSLHHRVSIPIFIQRRHSDPNCHPEKFWINCNIGSSRIRISWLRRACIKRQCDEAYMGFGCTIKQTWFSAG